MPVLDDLSPSRRATLERRRGPQAADAGQRLQDFIEECAQRACRILDWHPLLRDASALLGDDGRYHLAVAGRAWCAGRRFPATPVGAQCHRLEVRLPASRTLGTPEQRTARPPVFVARWIVHLSPDGREPATVPPGMRCPIGLLDWPTFIDQATTLGRVRAVLVETLGSVCHACGRHFATCVDHDHETGMVRGLLCRHCNTRIDDCCHPRGCPWADYLNNPPAAALGLRYPHHNKTLARRRARR